jgi:hypothetical protein
MIIIVIIISLEYYVSFVIAFELLVIYSYCYSLLDIIRYMEI